MSSPLIINPLGGPHRGLSVTGADGEPTILRQIGGGLVTGFRETPVLGWMFEHSLLDSGLVDPQTLDNLAKASDASPFGYGARIVGEWAPQLIGGAALWNVGRKLALGAAASVAESALGGTAGAQVVRQAALAGATAGDTAPLLQRMLGGPMRKQLADMVLLMRGAPGEVSHIPAVARIAEALGGSTVFGALETSDALLHDKPLAESLQEGAKVAALSLAAEGVLTVGAKALFPGAQAIDRSLYAAKLKGNKDFQAHEIGQRATYKGELASATTKVGDLTQNVQMLNIARTLAGQQARVHLTAQIAKANSKLAKAVGVEGAAAARLKTFEEGIGIEVEELGLLTNQPIGYGGGALARMRESANKLLLGVGMTPEQVAKYNGASTSRYVRLLQNAEVETAARRGTTLQEVQKARGLAYKATGTRQPLLGTGERTKFLLDYEGVARQQGGNLNVRNLARQNRHNEQELVALFDGVHQSMDDLHAALQSVGVKAVPPKGSFPVMFRDDLSVQQLYRQTVAGLRKLGEPLEIAEQRAEKLISRGRDGYSRKGSLFGDQQDELNAIVGIDLKKAVEAGLPVVDDPLVALQMYLDSGWKRFAYAKRLGPGYEMEQVLRGATEREGASVAIFDQIANAAMLRNLGDQGSRRMAAAVANLQVGTKMTMSVVANASQSFNAALRNGVLNTLKFIVPGGRGRTQIAAGMIADEAVTATGLANTILSGWRETYLDPNFRTPLGWLADGVFSVTQFNRVEGWNRKVAGATGLYDTVRTLGMMAEGRLRGSAYATAARRLEALNFNVPKVAAQLKQLTQQLGDPDQAMAQLLNAKDGELLKRIAWRSTQLSQFIPTATRKPTMWQTPLGRVMFQFKTYALNQARLLRDTVINEAAQGNYTPLLVAAAFGPPTGEVVASIRAGLKGEKRREHGLDRLLADVGAIGGLGLVSDTVLAARGSRTLGFAAGPTLSDASRIIEALASDNAGDRLQKQAAKLPIIQALGWLRYPLGAIPPDAMKLFRETHGPALLAEGEGELSLPTLSDYGRTQQ